MISESELQQFWNDHAEWSQKTFGLDGVRGPEGPLNHLAKEVQEALANTDDPDEYADLLLLTFDAARRSGLTFGELIGVARSKLGVNKMREWQKPNPDGSVEHVREEHCPRCEGRKVYNRKPCSLCRGRVDTGNEFFVINTDDMEIA